METLMTILMVWIATGLGLPENAPMPNVHYLPGHHLSESHHGPGTVNERDRVLGLYFDTAHTIFLHADWDADSIADLSILVHELTHHLQRQTDRQFACAEAREALPFEAQARFLAYFGEDLESAFGIDPFTLAMKTNCLPY